MTELVLLMQLRHQVSDMLGELKARTSAVVLEGDELRAKYHELRANELICELEYEGGERNWMARDEKPIKARYWPTLAAAQTMAVRLDRYIDAAAKANRP
jgi:hypothetical protein